MFHGIMNRACFRGKNFILVLVTVTVVIVLYLVFIIPDFPTVSVTNSKTPDLFGSYLNGSLVHHEFRNSTLIRDYPFEFNGDDVLVFLHIQKTGGSSMERHLVQNLKIPKPCQCYKHRKRCDCFNQEQHIWLFSRFSTGWACGLHADWTELQNCVADAITKKEDISRPRRYLYMTMLRDPYRRYLSEWMHVKRGATWMGAALKCDGRHATLTEVPFCFEGDDWSGVTLDDFLSCRHNLASNRQARMLANLSKVNCYNQTAMPSKLRDKLLLESAKANLLDLAFFGILEFLPESQYLFEKTFNLNFIDDFVPYNTTHAHRVMPTEVQRQQILQVNRLDIQLYQFAKDLFLQRLKNMGIPSSTDTTAWTSRNTSAFQGGRADEQDQYSDLHIHNIKLEPDKDE